ncbi:hypothetical protein EWI07_04465 [Sporolactobacillus sp. THM7-4]|nr:hypothetical protein EWI07_04465 [Sporolactobacillus sp. THM7-4]
MTYGYFLFLQLVGRFNGERSLSGIYHLLKGKQSAQPIQDSYLYHVRPFFHSLDTLKRDEFDRVYEECKEKDWLEPSDVQQESVRLTGKGAAFLATLRRKYTLPEGIYLTDYINEETSFWLKLQLTVQTLSELVHGRNAFLPVTRQPAVTESVRHFLQITPIDREKLSGHVFEELSRLLAEGPDDEANVLVGQLSGFGTGGLTIDQLSHQLERDIFECRMLHKAAIRRMMDHLSTRSGAYPFLSRLLDRKRGTLSLSASRTFQYINRGCSLEEISQARHLSRGTIEDHIVEIALKTNDFSCSPYLSEEVDQSVMEVVSQIQTRQLKRIKERLHDKASYFQIRLSLAKHAGEYGGTR